MQQGADEAARCVYIFRTTSRLFQQRVTLAMLDKLWVQDMK